MGLDVRAFSDIRKCEVQSDDSYNKYTNCVELIPNDIVFNQSCGLSGYYTYSNNGYITFRAGAYSSYDKWRRMLSEMIGYKIEDLWDPIIRDSKISEIINEKTDSSIPFIELICFSDCEGFVGTEVSKKLYNDFIDNKEKAITYSKSVNNSDWLSLYDDFTNAFKIASNNGALQFC